MTEQSQEILLSVHVGEGAQAPGPSYTAAPGSGAGTRLEVEQSGLNHCREWFNLRCHNVIIIFKSYLIFK